MSNETCVRATEYETFTPGPWRVIGDGTEVLALEETRSAIVVAATKFFEGPPTSWECANARLIAGAPELLEAGKELLNAFLAVAPSTMQPRVVQDAMSRWLDVVARVEGRET